MSNRGTILPAYVFFIFIELMYGFELTYIKLPSVIYNAFLYICILSFIWAVSISKWTLQEAIKVVFLLSIALGVYISSKESLYFILVFSAIIIKCISYKNALITIFITRLIILIAIISLSLLGVIPLNEMQVAKGVQGFTTGYGLGFIHPNDLAQAIFIVEVIYLCIRKNKIDIKDKLGLFIIILINYLITKSRTILFISLFILLMLIIKNTNYFNKIINYFSLLGYPIIIIISLAIPYLYNEATGMLQHVAFLFNGILSGRFSNASMLFHNFPITLFGKIVNTDLLQSIYGYNVVDNGYVFLLFNYGVIGSVVILFLYFYSMKRLVKQEEYVYLTIVFSFLLLGMMENVIRSVAINFTMIFWYEFISKRNVIKN